MIFFVSKRFRQFIDYHNPTSNSTELNDLNREDLEGRPKLNLITFEPLMILRQVGLGRITTIPGFIETLNALRTYKNSPISEEFGRFIMKMLSSFYKMKEIMDNITPTYAEELKIVKGYLFVCFLIILLSKIN